MAPEDAAKEKPGMESPPPWSLSLLLRPAVAVPVLSARLRLPNPICAALADCRMMPAEVPGRCCMNCRRAAGFAFNFFTASCRFHAFNSAITFSREAFSS